MPEMLAYAGRSFTVDAVIHRTCDTVKAGGTGGTTRRVERAVHLEGVRCNGSSHGGCQARCLIFWKEDWLEKAPLSHTTRVPNDGSQSRQSAAVDEPMAPDFLLAATRDPGQSEDNPIYSCQATEMSRATSFVSARDPRIWLQDWRSRNASARTALASIAVLLFNKWQGAQHRLPRPLRIGSGRGWPSFAPSGEKRRYPPLDLQPGEVVEVRSKEEIEATLDDKGCLRGLRFAAEMIPYCGTRARVLDRVERIIDEKTGRMLRLRDCIMLEHVWCQGTFRALCRRKIYTYWREAWLRRVENKGCSDTRPGDEWGAV